mmetsp:Transcript_30820/g.99373  ORF Transcript_30820/g.99373 Transcript_30820/m.99373 type:complete len:308 (-) Transcript_30820:1106-2029(-)
MFDDDWRRRNNSSFVRDIDDLIRILGGEEETGDGGAKAGARRAAEVVELRREVVEGGFVGRDVEGQGLGEAEIDPNREVRVVEADDGVVVGVVENKSGLIRRSLFPRKSAALLRRRALGALHAEAAAVASVEDELRRCANKKSGADDVAAVRCRAEGGAAEAAAVEAEAVVGVEAVGGRVPAGHFVSADVEVAVAEADGDASAVSGGLVPDELALEVGGPRRAPGHGVVLPGGRHRDGVSSHSEGPHRPRARVPLVARQVRHAEQTEALGPHVAAGADERPGPRRYADCLPREQNLWGLDHVEEAAS